MKNDTDGPPPLVEAVSRSAWNRALFGLGRVPLQQSWGYGAAMAQLGLGVTRLSAERDSKTVAAAQVIERRLAGRFRLETVLNGPLWGAAATDRDRQAFLKQLRARYRRRSVAFLLIAPDRGDSVETTRLYRTIGAHRVMTGSEPKRLVLTRAHEYK